jgi:hypothetical protein
VVHASNAIILLATTPTQNNKTNEYTLINPHEELTFKRRAYVAADFLLLLVVVAT